MKKTLSAAAALALLLLIAAVIVQGALLPLLAGDAETDSTREALRHYRSIAADRDRLRQAIAALPPLPADAGRLPQTSDALALAELQSRLTAMTAPLGLVLSAAEPLAADQDDGSGRVQLRLDLNGSLAGLQALIHGIESGRPVMAVTALDLQARPDQQGLSARLTVAAWRSPS